MKTVLITGTSTGVGYEASLLFARNGFKVYATMRNLAKGQVLEDLSKAENLPIDILQLDVTDNSSIEKAVQTIIEKEGKIDLLINNAGSGFAKNIEEASLEEIDWVTDVNYKGVVLVTRAVLPYMRQARSGKVINISSVGGLVGQPFNELYCGAKFAVEGFTEALASYVGSQFNIDFIIIEPGGIATEFFKSAIANSSDQDGKMASGDYEKVLSQYVARQQARSASGEASPYQTGAEVAQVIFEVADLDNPPLRIRTSKWAEDLTTLKTQADPDGTTLLNQVIDTFL